MKSVAVRLLFGLGLILSVSMAGLSTTIIKAEPASANSCSDVNTYYTLWASGYKSVTYSNLFRKGATWQLSGSGSSRYKTDTMWVSSEATFWSSVGRWSTLYSTDQTYMYVRNWGTTTKTYQSAVDCTP